MTHSVFSEYLVKKTSVKFANETEYNTMDCVGTNEEELNTKVVTKKCRGVVAKTRVIPTGDGTLKLSLHVPYDVFCKAWNLSDANMKQGVYKYGQDSHHPEFTLVQLVEDEDGNQKYKAYPRCIIQTGITRKVENGAEEVALSDIEISIMPDENGNALYEGLAENMSSDLQNAWLTSFSVDLVTDSTNTYSITRALTHCSMSNTKSVVTANDSFFTEITAEDGYELPSSITVSDGSTLVSGTDYLYTITDAVASTTATLFIPKFDADTSITIVATA